MSLTCTFLGIGTSVPTAATLLPLSAQTEVWVLKKSMKLNGISIEFWVSVPASALHVSL
ncbi:hypothetical protein MLC35_11405 [Sulfurimonas sp. NW7]|uniref:hypothetical protein n=1 Tax=Sulfurimonas sp. NW7 TaxID=2922727 RepID=UPI003DA97420